MALMALHAMVSDALSVGAVQAGAAGAADRGAAAFVLVGGCDVADAGVQPHGVVLDAYHGELGAQNGGVGDRDEVWPVGLDVAEETLDPGLVSRGAGPPKCCAIAHIAMNSRVDPDVICGPLSDARATVVELLGGASGPVRLSAGCLVAVAQRPQTSA